MTNLRPLVYLFRGLECRSRDYGGITEQYEFAETLTVGVKSAFMRRPKGQEQIAIYIDCEDAELLNFGHANLEHLFHRIETYLGLIGEIVFFSPGKSEAPLIRGFKDFGACPVISAKKDDISEYVSDTKNVPPHFWDLDTNEKPPGSNRLLSIAKRICGLESPFLATGEFFNANQD